MITPKSEVEEKSFEYLFKNNPQRIVYESDYRRIAEKYLNQIAVERGLSEADITEIADSPEGFCGLVEYYLDPLFGSVTTKNEKLYGKYVNEEFGKEKYFRWFHRHTHHILKDIFSDEIEIFKDDFQTAAASYINQNKFHDEWLDWYCADILCYNEYIETLRAASIEINGIVVSLMLGSKSRLIKMSAWVLKGVIFIIKWAIWFAIMATLVNIGMQEVWTNVLIVILLLLTVFVQSRKWKIRKKLGALLDSMGRAYVVLASTTFSWEILWRSLDDSRKLGAVWPGELWRLVELRRITKF